MKLINIHDDPSNLFTDICKYLESKAPVEFLMIYGFGGAVSEEYINSQTEEHSSSKDKGSKRPIPVIIGGHESNSEFNTSFPPAFNFSYNYLGGNLRNKEITFFERLVPENAPDNVIPILSPSEVVFGELIIQKNGTPTFYLLYDIFDTALKEGVEFIKTMINYFLEKVLIQLGYSIEPTPLEESNEVGKLEDKIAGFFDKVNKENIEKLETYSKSIDNLREKMTIDLRLYKEYKQKVESNSDVEKVKRELEIINNRPDVLWVDIKEDYLLIATERIQIKKQLDGVNKVFDIGNILMKINIHTGQVFFDNMIRRRRGVGHNISSHPHDASQGDCKMCLGEITAFVPEMINELELASLTELMLNYARSVNIGDAAGKYIVHWPTVK